MGTIGFLLMGTKEVLFMETKEVLLMGTIGFLQKGDKRHRVFFHGEYRFSSHWDYTLITNGD